MSIKNFVKKIKSNVLFISFLFFAIKKEKKKERSGRSGFHPETRDSVEEQTLQQKTFSAREKPELAPGKEKSGFSSLVTFFSFISTEREESNKKKRRVNKIKRTFYST